MKHQKTRIGFFGVMPMRDTQNTGLTESHEAFEVEETQVLKRRIVRQERISVPSGKCFVLLNDLKLEVTDYTAFGIATLSPVAILPGIEALDVAFLYEGI